MAIFSDSHPQQHLPITLTLVNKTKPRLQRETQNQRLVCLKLSLLLPSSSDICSQLTLSFSFLFSLCGNFLLLLLFIVIFWDSDPPLPETMGSPVSPSWLHSLSLHAWIRVTVVASRFLSSTMAFSECTSHFQSLGLFNSCSPFSYRENITAKQVKKQNRVFFFFFFWKEFKWFWIGITRLSRVKQNLRLGAVFSSLFFFLHFLGSQTEEIA